MLNEANALARALVAMVAVEASLEAESVACAACRPVCKKSLNETCHFTHTAATSKSTTGVTAARVELVGSGPASTSATITAFGCKEASSCDIEALRAEREVARKDAGSCSSSAVAAVTAWRRLVAATL